MNFREKLLFMIRAIIRSLLTVSRHWMRIKSCWSCFFLTSYYDCNTVYFFPGLIILISSAWWFVTLSDWCLRIIQPKNSFKLEQYHYRSTHLKRCLPLQIFHKFMDFIVTYVIQIVILNRRLYIENHLLQSMRAGIML